MKANKSTAIWLGVIVIVIIGLFVYARIIAKPNSVSGTNIPCLIENLPLAQHIHPHLTIGVDGKGETVPADIGISSSCEKVLHTHDDSGIIHVEAQDAKQYTFGDFMSVWGKSLERPGFSYEVSIDGKVVGEPLTAVLKDNQEIIVKYKKV